MPTDAILPKAREAELKVELINVGHGDALILHWLPEVGTASTILVDGGTVVGAKRISETLSGLGATSIDLAVLTHCDADHVDGLLAYARDKDRLPIHRYWGPCIPAFRRHDWLFNARIGRGLTQAEALEATLDPSCKRSWPVEGANWVSSDGDLSIRVISPAGRLIERLLVGTDSLSLFLERPTPLGWLLESPVAEDDIEDPFADLRFAISTAEISPDRVPPLPPIPRPASAEEFADEAETGGIEPEFFGNSVLNDTSIVLLVEARIGVVQRRLLLTGDLENFTYLMGRHPMGLGCDIVKSPHHGSYSYVDREVAYDAVWQWLRPRAALVSANGKHGLPRVDFRDAALRYGATLFCTSRRSREIVSGPTLESCCNVQFACNSQAPISLSVTAKGINSDGVACASGTLAGVMPIIQVRQHVVEPSPILSTLAETEIRKHMDWAVTWLRRILVERQSSPPDSELKPISIEVMRQAATAARRLAAASEMEVILERAAREGKVWLYRSDRYRGRGDRSVWVMPTRMEMAQLTSWIDEFNVVQLAVKPRHAAAAPEELLYAAGTDWIAQRLAERFAFPRAMFKDALWPILVDHLLRTRSVGIRFISGSTHRDFGASVLLILFREQNPRAASATLSKQLSTLESDGKFSSYLREAVRWANDISGSPPEWPDALASLVTPLWVDTAVPPSGIIANQSGQMVDLAGKFEGDGAAEFRKWIARLKLGLTATELSQSLACSALASLILSGYEIISKPTERS